MSIYNYLEFYVKKLLIIIIHRLENINAPLHRNVARYKAELSNGKRKNLILIIKNIYSMEQYC